MRRAIIIIGLLAAIVFGTGWRGGNTADYNADTICAVKYKIHPPRTDVGCEGCKPFVQMLPCVPVVIAGDTLCLPVLNLDSLADTVYIASETLYIDTSWLATETVVVAETVYNYDTVVYIQQGNAFWTAINRYMCDSTIVAIDTTTSPYDTVWCKFCDSVLVITWWQRTETSPGIERYAYWELLTDNINDTCDIYRPGRRNLIYTVCYDCDTNIYIDTAIFVDSLVLQNAGFWVVDSLTGDEYYVHLDDTVYLHPSGGSHTGDIWWRYCDDSDVYVWTDSFDLFTCIDTTWRVCWHRLLPDVWSERVNYTLSSCGYMAGIGYTEPYYAVQNTCSTHNTYEDMVKDSINYYFGDDTIIINNGADTILAVQSIYMDWDTLDAYGVFTRPCGCHCHYNTERCTGTDYWNTCNCDDGDRRTAKLELFSKVIDFAWIYPESTLEALNNEQPHWVITTFADDFVHFITVNGELFYLDTIPSEFYGWHIYEIAPTDLNYKSPIKVNIGVGSDQSPYIGGQVLLGFKMASDSTDIVWRNSDTLIIPPCCPDTLCFEYRRRINPQDSATFANMGANVICSGAITGDKYCWVVIDSCYSTCIDTVIYEFSPRIRNIATGASEFAIKTDIVVHDTSAFLKLYNDAFESDSILLFFSKSGKGYDAEQIWITLPDSVRLHHTDTDTPAYNFVYYVYNNGQPDLVDTNTNIIQDDYIVVDSVVYIGEYIIGRIDTAADTVEIFNYHDFMNSVNQSLLHINCNLLQEADYISGIEPTIRAKSVAISNGLIMNNKHFYVPARDNRKGDKLIVINWADSNYAHFDSLSDIYEYADGSPFGANEYLWMVLWGAVSTDTSKFRLYLNVQEGGHTYNQIALCEQDKWHMIPTQIPDEFRRTGFLIAAFIWSTQGDSTVYLSDGKKYRDLRGLNPQVAGGVVTGSVDSTIIIEWGFYNSDVGHLEADSIRIGGQGASWIKEWSIDASGDTLWFIIGADTFYAPRK